MGFGYTPRKKTSCFDPARHGKGSTPYAVSRSKIDLFVECPRCFFLDQRHGIKRPDMPPFSLNNAVDELMKKEFDLLRDAEEAHPLMKEYGIDAVPFRHEDLPVWRDALRNGIKFLEPKTGLLVRGGIDDVWINADGELHIVDYKATSKREKVSLDAAWQDGYKRQVEVYQWLFRQNGFRVSSIAYFVYVNGKADAERFDGKLEFEAVVIPYSGDDAWIEPLLLKLHACLVAPVSPPPAKDCSYCVYRKYAGETLLAEKNKK